MSIANELNKIQQEAELLKAKELIMLKQGLASNNPADLVSANLMLKGKMASQQADYKSYVFSPDEFLNSFGYKDKPTQLSYDALRRMAKAPIIKSIIGTRIEQVAAFAEPQQGKYDTGFVIRKKSRSGDPTEQELSKKDRAIIDKLTEFILNCGFNANSWNGQSFDEFLRMLAKDSLELDQSTFEVVRTRGNEIVEFMATDAATFRYADSLDHAKAEAHDKIINGYPPAYVQLYMNRIVAEYHPWELSFGVRNPTTDVMKNRYGNSELEDLITTVTSMLYSDQYNMKFFSQGSAPKGILKVSGNIGETKLAEFRRQWQAQIGGVENAWKTPMLDAEKMEWIDLQKNNRDMEFSKWQEYLIKISCAAYKIDPSEIGFPLGGSADAKPMFEGNNEARLKYSKDKGLNALLKHIQARINKYLISQINPEFEFAFVGLNTGSAGEDLDTAVKEVANIKTLNEVRQERGLEPIEGGDIVLNSMFLQNKSQEAMAAQQAAMGDPESNGAVGSEWGEEPEGDLWEDEEESPITKALNDFIKKDLQ